MNHRIEHKRLVAAALAAALLGGCAGTPTQESTGEYLDDTARTVLFQDPRVSGLAMNVETFKGEVQLSGFATTRNGTGLRNGPLGAQGRSGHKRYPSEVTAR